MLCRCGHHVAKERERGKGDCDGHPCSKILSVLPSPSQTLTTMSSSDDGDDPKLPHDVAVEVLKRLPVESLLRCRCVCRSWRSAIDDPRFVALHLSHSALYLACLDWCGRLCSLFPNESLALPSRSQVEIPFVTFPACYMIVGWCNGLICVTETSIRGYGRTMYLWNLFTRKHKAVRRSGMGDQSLSMATTYEALGFGFDARLNDCKIVRILFCLDDSHRCFAGTKARIEIYSLGTDFWVSLERELPAFCDDEPAVFLNGSLHWIAFKFDVVRHEGKYGAILRFDVAGEVFDEMSLPQETFHEDNDGVTVFAAVLNDLLAVLISHGAVSAELRTICSVWVMRKYGVPESWTKLYSFEACGLVTRFDGSTGNGELLMEINGEESVSWDPITGQYTNLPLSTHCKLVTVVESLASL